MEVDELEKHRLAERNVIKLLLLGSGNSGKSTIMKQFKIMHKFGFTAEVKSLWGKKRKEIKEQN